MRLSFPFEQKISFLTSHPLLLLKYILTFPTMLTDDVDLGIQLAGLSLSSVNSHQGSDSQASAQIKTPERDYEDNMSASEDLGPPAAAIAEVTVPYELPNFTVDELIELELLRDQEIDALVNEGFVPHKDRWNLEHRDGFNFLYPEWR